jgi:sterol desaturase/sphingolipid hydroxylase (fatty acid hydroxylase superfamily)
MIDLVPHERTLRLGAFVAAFVLLAGWEAWAPRRSDATRRRWLLNLSLAALNALVVRLVVPASGLTFALWAEARGTGLLGLVRWPGLFEWLVAVVALDAAVYAQHRLFHAVPVLWWAHRLHHEDRALDVTTGVRFHPVEILASTVGKGGAIVALGAPPAAVLLFELALNLGSLFSHANIRLAADPWWRLLLVTPDMHRTHHSADPREQQRNFGFCLSWWDRLAGTYQRAPRVPTETMPLGLAPPDDRAMLIS